MAFTFLCGALLPAAANSRDTKPIAPKDGQVHATDASFEVWDARMKAWVDPELFWMSYAETGPGKFWGRSATYPRYRDVNEHDTIVIEVATGPCLMYFFHRRWRRAQDVRRWDPTFNDIGGCPKVFD